MSLPDPCLETSAISSFKGKGILEGRPIREICKKEKVGEGELKVGGAEAEGCGTPVLDAWRLSREYGIAPGKNARDLGGCTSAIGRFHPPPSAGKKNADSKLITQWEGPQ